MPLIRKPHAWTRQPQHPVGIDWRNPLTRGLRFFSAPGVGIKHNVAAETVGTRMPSHRGMLGNFTGAEYQKARAGILTDARNTVMGGAISANGSEGFNCLFSSNYDGGVNEPFSIRRQSVLKLTTYNAGNEYWVDCTPPAADEYFTWYCALGAGGATDTNTIGWISTSGAVTENSASIAMASRTGFDAYLGAGANGSSVWRYYVKPMLWGAYWDRELSVAERMSMARNPWQILVPDRRTIFIPSAGGAVSLVIADSAHGHAADNLTLNWQALLSVSDASHAHAADSLTLSTQWLLAIADALHAHAADNLTIGTTGSTILAIAEATHGHAADSLTLTTQWLLAIADTLHANAADSLVLDTSNATWLTLQDATHGHLAEAVILTLSNWLAIAESQHGHLADTVHLDPGQIALAIAEAVHAHLADNLTLSVVYPGAFIRAPAGSGPQVRCATGSRPGSQNTLRPADLGGAYPTTN